MVDTSDLSPTATSIPITWVAPNTLGEFDGFLISYESADDTVTVVDKVFADVDMYLITGLGVGQTYTISVQTLSGRDTITETASAKMGVEGSTGENTTFGIFCGFLRLPAIVTSFWFKSLPTMTRVG